jgi:NTE family protein
VKETEHEPGWKRRQGAYAVSESAARGGKTLNDQSSPKLIDDGPEAVDSTVFVLGGGGNLGAVQVGMLRALLESGARPDAIIGTSIGALNGAFLAGHCGVDGLGELGDLWASVRRHDVFPMNPRSLTRGVFGHQQYLFESLGLRSLLSRARFGFEHLEDAPISLSVMATDLETGEAVVLAEGETITSLLASSAIPGVFPPVEIRDRVYIDGGVVANVPVAEAALLEPSHIYVLPTVPEQSSRQPANAIVMMQHAMTLAAKPGFRRDLVEASARSAVHLLPVPTAAGHLSIFDFRATERLIRESYELTTDWLEGKGSPGGGYFSSAGSTMDAVVSKEPAPSAPRPALA